MRSTTTLLFLLALAFPVTAQTRFRADLDGSQEVPPTASGACAWGTVVINPDDSVTYDVRARGITATAAHIHAGAAGINGGVVVPLSGGPTTWSGTSSPLTAGQLASLRSEGMYVNIHSGAFPGGEIRGQILPSPRVFAAHLTGSQEVPSTGSSHTARGLFTVNSDRTVTFDVSATGVDDATGLHIHSGAVGVNGGVVVNMGPPAADGSSSGTSTEVLTVAEFSALQDQGLYANLHTSAVPSGELRGQVIPSGEPYFTGTGCTSVSFSIDGAGTSNGGVFDVSISGGEPGGVVYLLASLGPDLTSVKLNPFLLDVADLFLVQALPLDGAGELAFPATYGPFGLGGTIAWQVYAQDPGALGGFRASNGVIHELVVLP